MSNRRLLMMAGGLGAQLANVTIMSTIATAHSNGQVLNSMGINSLLEVGFTLWAEGALVAGGDEIRVEFTDAFGTPFDNSYRIGRAVPGSFLRTTLPLSMYMDLYRGGADDPGFLARMHGMLDDVNTMASFITTTNLDTTDRCPVGVTLEIVRASGTTVNVNLCSRAPGATSVTRVAGLTGVSLALSTGKRFGLDWVSGQVTVWHEDRFGGGVRTTSAPMSLSPTPWQVGGYGRGGLSYRTTTNSGRPFINALYWTR